MQITRKHIYTVIYVDMSSTLLHTFRISQIIRIQSLKYSPSGRHRVKRKPTSDLDSHLICISELRSLIDDDKLFYPSTSSLFSQDGLLTSEKLVKYVVLSNVFFGYIILLYNSKR